MKKIQTCWKRILAALLMAALLVSVIPLYAISAYSYAGPDDYRYGRTTHDVWEQTGSVFGTAAEAANVTAQTYADWQGSYAAIFFMALHPGIFSADAYGISTWILLSALLLALIWFVYTALRKLVGSDADSAWIVAALTAIGCIQFLPSPVEGYFWFNGGVYYTFFFSLSLLAATLLIRRTEKRTVAQCILLPLLAVLIGGGNLVTGLLSCGLLALYTLMHLLQKKKDPLLWVTLALLLAGFFINAAAPGNGVRQVEHAEAAQGPVRAILCALGDAAQYSAKWLCNPASLLLLAALPLLWITAGKCRFAFRLPGFVTVFSFLLLAAGFTPTEYALSFAGEARLMDIQFYLFVLLLLGNLLWWTGWFRQRWDARGTKDGHTPRRAAVTGIATSCAMLLLAGGVTLYSRSCAGISAWRTLRSGNAQSYAQIWEERLEMLNDKTEQTVTLPRLMHQPPLLCMVDIEPSEDGFYYWYNEQLEAYFEKQLVLRQPDPAE